MICYTCQKENLETPFCCEECHRIWMETHPVSPKFGRSIADLQKLVLSWRKHGSRELTNDVSDEVAQMIFS